MKTGKFITFEGPEGSGKSTQIRFAEKWFKARGQKVLVLREPGGTETSEAIRNILLHASDDLSSEVETFLFLASRRDLVEKKILPALASGKVVLCDRFQDSTWVYQTFAGNFPQPLFEKMGEVATGGLKPDLTFVFDVPVTVGLNRAGKSDRIEKKSAAFHEKVRRGYLEVVRCNKKRCVLIPFKEGIELVQGEVRKVLERVCK
ncbi:MAG: dTMP kinase [Candidatus Omnitrophica bacterium]|nr:dTMP kinase [Candidatus Omnitrophota bacterium]